MPITILAPQPNEPWGLGFPLKAETSFIGPIVNPEWLVRVTDSTNENVISQTTYTFQSGIPLIVSRYLDDAFVAATGKSAQGLNGHVIVELVGSSGIVEQATVQTVMDYTSGILPLFQHGPGGVSGGFTETDRTTLTTTSDNTTTRVMSEDAAGGEIAIGVGELLGQLVGVLAHSHASVGVTGQGSLSRGSGAWRQDSIGIQWNFTEIPPGFGFEAGAVAEEQRRILQLRMLTQDISSALYQSAVVDTHRDGDRFIWGNPVPQTIEFFVAPGCSAQLTFLTALPL